LEREVFAAWNDKDPRSVLSSLTNRFSSNSNINIRATILSICASVVRGIGADFVRRVWMDYPVDVPLTPLAEASASCLPHDEGFNRVTTALSRLDTRERRDQMSCLCHFHSQDALVWIERNVCEPITESWGYLAAASDFDWKRSETWLGSGRPLSLIAIDALLAIAWPRTPFLRETKPKLAAPPSRASLEGVLLAYRQRDPVPRVQQRIDAVLSHAKELTSEGSDG
jgi:hypothetical protein